MKKDDLFEKIVAGEIPADILYQDEYITAFEDINPQAPVHVLIVPNRNIPTLNACTNPYYIKIILVYTVNTRTA